jgi:hypothetical protein
VSGRVSERGESERDILARGERKGDQSEESEESEEMEKSVDIRAKRANESADSDA